MIYIKYCKRCGEAFDIDISKDYCPKCRRDSKKMKGAKEDGNNRETKTKG